MNSPRISTILSDASEPYVAIEQIAAGLDVATRGQPGFMALHFGVGTDAAGLYAAARARFPGVALHGGSSCLGVMSDNGLQLDSGAGAGAFAVWDAAGSFGTASADLRADARAAARRATEAALDAAGRPGEVPDLVWLTVAPGREEQVLRGIADIVGPGTPVLGGSAADNDVSGAWAQFGPGALHRDGVVVSVLFPSVPVASAYQSGYAPTGASGHVTRVVGRRLVEIEGRPAAAVYQEWTGGAVPTATDGPVSILGPATLWPLGRVTRDVSGVPFHLLAHPATAHPDGALDLFADVAEGERLWQMRGSADSLVARAGRVAAQAREELHGAVAGALVVYCGGCMLAVRERMAEVRAGLDAALEGAPWLGVFTFGEQGAPPGEQAGHGNLMISCTVFAAS
jgi:hypothetical protein